MKLDLCGKRSHFVVNWPFVAFMTGQIESVQRYLNAWWVSGIKSKTHAHSLRKRVRSFEKDRILVVIYQIILNERKRAT